MANDSPTHPSGVQGSPLDRAVEGTIEQAGDGRIVPRGSIREAAGRSGEAPEPLAPNLADLWMLDPAVDFLNHGSFGALPRRVASAQAVWRDRIESRPVAILGRSCAALLRVARQGVASLVGADPADLGFVTNATEGINAFLQGTALAPGDEIVTSNHVYNAVRQAMRHRARMSGATYLEVELPIPLAGAHEVVCAIDAALTPRTRLVVVDHVTSPTALRLPIEAIATHCAARGVDLLVDGAHAPGMIPVDLTHLGGLGVTAYAANLHKWICAPKGSAFLWVRPDRQKSVHPLVVSHFLDAGFEAEFGWQGTRDISGWLSVPDAILFLEGLGLARVMAHNQELARWSQRMLCDAWSVTPISPIDGSMLGSMATVPLPDPLQPAVDELDSGEARGAGAAGTTGGIAGKSVGSPRRDALTQAFQARLYTEFRIEVPVVDFAGRWHVRPCCQIYNSPEQLMRLAESILTLAEATTPRA